MAALIREPPRADGPTRRVSLRASVDELDVSAIARKSGGGGHRQAAGFSSELSIPEITDFVVREFVEARDGWKPKPSAPTSTDGASRHTTKPLPGSPDRRNPCRRARSSRRGSSWDKPAGPSSFAIVAQLRGRTGARTGHTGTLDPFATGLLVLLSGRATRPGTAVRRPGQALRDRHRPADAHGFGRREGVVVEEREAPDADELAAAVAALHGEVERRSPRHPAVKIEGERAYRLHRRGVAVEMPTRRSQIHDAGSSPTRRRGDRRAPRRLRDVRARGRERARRPLRDAAPDEVGPFHVEEADPERIIHPAEALARLASEGAEVRVARPQ